jgi:hypothetical protein
MIYRATLTGCRCVVFYHDGWWGIEGTYGLSKVPTGYLLSNGIDVDKIPQDDWCLHDTQIKTEQQVIDLVKGFARISKIRRSE